MICQIIFSKKLCRIFLSFCRSNFVNISVAKDSLSEPGNHQKLNISRPFYFFKNSFHTILKISRRDFFFSFPLTWSFFHNCETTNLGVIFLYKKLVLNLFQVWLFNFSVISKACFKNLFKKTWKKLVILHFEIILLFEPYNLP